MADRATPDQKANAVARVLAGESRRKVAGELGVADTTVKRWVDAAVRSGAELRSTEQQEKKIADDATALAQRIIDRQEEVRQLLLDRIAELVPTTEDLRAVATAYGIVTDKSLLLAGKPTGIHEHRSTDPLDVEIEQLLSEEAAKKNGASS